jgi:hypothetical protein
VILLGEVAERGVTRCAAATVLAAGSLPLQPIGGDMSVRLSRAATSGAQQTTKGRGGAIAVTTPGRSGATSIVVSLVLASVDLLWRPRAISLRSRRAFTKSSCHLCIPLERAVIATVPQM